MKMGKSIMEEANVVLSQFDFWEKFSLTSLLCDIN